MEDSEDQIAAFVDYAALTYHEARNVRHLVRAGFIAAENYQRLVNLPRERKAAWREMQPGRAEAKTKTTARAAEAAFRVRFGVGVGWRNVIRMCRAHGLSRSFCVVRSTVHRSPSGGLRPSA